jgi:hypothetical protein
LFTTKENLVFMDNLYHKVAVASVGIALGFALGANKEAKAATFTLTLGSGNNGTSFLISDTNQDGLGDYHYGGAGVPLPVGRRYSEEFKTFYEFNIAKLSLTSNTVISSAIFQATKFENFPEDMVGNPYDMVLFGYIGNGQADLSDFQSEAYLNFNGPITGFPIVSYNVTSFIQQIVSNNNDFAGFGLRRPYNNQPFFLAFNRFSSLTITTVDAEPVPEPTTIFGSAIALSVGGWLKRKKLSQHNKTTPHN